MRSAVFFFLLYKIILFLKTVQKTHIFYTTNHTRDIKYEYLLTGNSVPKIKMVLASIMPTDSFHSY